MAPRRTAPSAPSRRTISPWPTSRPSFPRRCATCTSRSRSRATPCRSTTACGLGSCRARTRCDSCARSGFRWTDDAGLAPGLHSFRRKTLKSALLPRFLRGTMVALRPSVQSIETRPSLAEGTSPQSETLCAHCGLALEAGGASRFCCAGCEAVYGLLKEQHLDRYYDLRGDRGLPVVRVDSRRRDRKWLEAIEFRVLATEGISRVEVDVQGLHCSACVWLFEELFRREKGGVSILVNPTVGRMSLAVEKPFSVRRFLEQVEAFGYLVGPRSREDRSAARPLLFRLGLCVAIAMNTMIFAFALYAGLATGPIFRLFQALELALGRPRSSSAAACSSARPRGPPAPRAAPRSADRARHRRGVRRLGSRLGHRARSVLRHAQRLHRAHARRPLPAGARAREEPRTCSSRATTSRACSRAPRRRRHPARRALHHARGRRPHLVAPFDLVPVDGVLEMDTSLLARLDQRREPPAHVRARGRTVPAGAFNAGSRAFVLARRAGFDDSSLTDILRTPPRALDEPAAATPWWKRYAPVYVIAVLTLAAGALPPLVGPVARRAPRPLGGHGGARRHVPVRVRHRDAAGLRARRRRAPPRGLFVRTPGFLDRAHDGAARRLRQDGHAHQGTVALSELVAARRALRGGDVDPRRPGRATAHPKSIAVAAALGDQKVQPAAIACEEVTGRGVEAFLDGRRYRFGEPQWATGAAGDVDLAFGCDGRAARGPVDGGAPPPGRAREVARLRRTATTSGSSPATLPSACARWPRPWASSASKALGGLGPDAKAAWLAEHDHGDVLMIGDGINDSLVVAKAYCAGTPAIDRPFMAARSRLLLHDARASARFAPRSRASRASRASCARTSPSRSSTTSSPSRFVSPA